MADETPTNEQGIPLEAVQEVPTNVKFVLETLEKLATLDPDTNNALQNFLDMVKEADEARKTELVLKEVEVSKLNLKENDVLVVKMQGMDLDGDLIRSLQKHFQKVFPNNKVLVFSLEEDAKMELEVVEAALLQEQPEASSCATAPAGYCEGCDCGKKEAALAASPPPVPPGPYRMPRGQLVKIIEAGHAMEGEKGTIDSYIGGGYYLVRFEVIGVIKVDGLGLEELKGA
jgi:hypothetical protein